jgi:dienelactone hydrolase
VVGIAEDGSQQVLEPREDKPFAIQAVEQGYVTFALEQLGFGERRDEASRRRGASEYSCRPAAGAALLLGQTMIGWRVWDVMRTIDYLATRPEADVSRIATMGVSGGGTTSLFAAALDERIKVGVVSAYFNTFRDSIVSLSHCMCNYIPRMLEYVEMYDLAGLVAPRFLFVESGDEDRIYPIDGSRTAHAKAQQIYQVFGVPERLGYDVWEGGHGFNGKGAFQFLETQL